MKQRPAPIADPHARLDAPDGILSEPLWGVRVRLSPLERALLRTPQLRRLHHVAWAGAARFATQQVPTRLQHVCGTFALAVTFAPDRPDVRAAALLHDVGHPPFSHALESIAEVDHHRFTAERIHSAPVADLLRAAALDPARVLALAEGEEPNVFKNHDGRLHVDHLDSLVRAAAAGGTLPVAPGTVLAGVSVDAASADGPRLVFDDATAEIVENLIEVEAHAHVSAVDLGASAMLAALVQSLRLADLLRAEELPFLTDADLTVALTAADTTRAEARRLLLRPWSVRQRKLEDDAPLPEGAILAVKERFYLDLPQRRNESDDERAERARALEERLDPLRGRYAVDWDPNDRDGEFVANGPAGAPWTATLGPVLVDASGVPDAPELGAERSDDDGSESAG